MMKILALFSVLTVTALLGGCVTSEKYDASLDEISTLSDEKRYLHESLNETRELLTQEKVARAELETDMASLKRERDEIIRSRDALFESNNELNDRVAELTRDKFDAMKAKDRTESELGDRIARLDREKQEAIEEKERAISKLKNTYDSLVSELNDEIRKGEIEVTQLRDKLTLSMVEKILFDSGKAAIKANGKAVLSRVAEILQSVTDKQIRIEGHTDNVPIGPVLAKTFPTNWELSTARSTTVVRYLQEKGVDPAFLSAAGYSEYRPVAPNDTDEGRARNRRIEIVLSPLDAEMTASPE